MGAVIETAVRKKTILPNVRTPRAQQPSSGVRMAVVDACGFAGNSSERLAYTETIMRVTNKRVNCVLVTLKKFLPNG